MFATLRLESKADHLQYFDIPAGVSRDGHLTPPIRLRTGLPRPWCARITGADPTYGLAREFLKPNKGYLDANRNGSSGIYLYFNLAPGIYEVQEMLAWNLTRRYFLRSEAGQCQEISLQEMDIWLKSV